MAKIDRFSGMIMAKILNTKVFPCINNLKLGKYILHTINNWDTWILHLISFLEGKILLHSCQRLEFDQQVPARLIFVRGVRWGKLPDAVSGLIGVQTWL